MNSALFRKLQFYLSSNYYCSYIDCTLKRFGERNTFLLVIMKRIIRGIRFSREFAEFDENVSGTLYLQLSRFIWLYEEYSVRPRYLSKIKSDVIHLVIREGNLWDMLLKANSLKMKHFIGEKKKRETGLK